MAKLDPEWAIAEIDKYLLVTERVGSSYGGSTQRGSAIEAAQAAHVVEQILNRVLPNWRLERPVVDRGNHWFRSQAARGKVAILRGEEIAEKLGENAPDMDAANLHTWAWSNGARFWTGGHYHQAVMQAAILINAETQTKLGRVDIGEVDLFNQAFTLDAPTASAPRLRLREDDGSKTFENLHRGARAFADGLYTAIRNPGMHVPSYGGEEQLALEQLAAFSLLARWVDQAEVLRA